MFCDRLGWSEFLLVSMIRLRFLVFMCVWFVDKSCLFLMLSLIWVVVGLFFLCLLRMCL